MFVLRRFERVFIFKSVRSHVDEELRRLMSETNDVEIFLSADFSEK